MMHTFNSLLRPPLLKGASWKGGINKKGRLMERGLMHGKGGLMEIKGKGRKIEKEGLVGKGINGKGGLMERIDYQERKIIRKGRRLSGKAG
jgi:hypothetical protein